MRLSDASVFCKIYGMLGSEILRILKNKAINYCEKIINPQIYGQHYYNFGVVCIILLLKYKNISILSVLKIYSFSS